MGQHCCQEVNDNEETSVVVGELQAAMEAQTFDEGHSQAAAHEADAADFVASECTTGPGEVVPMHVGTNVGSFMAAKAHTKMSVAQLERKALNRETSEAERKWQIELLEERITR